VADDASPAAPEAQLEQIGARLESHALRPLIPSQVVSFDGAGHLRERAGTGALKTVLLVSPGAGTPCVSGEATGVAPSRVHSSSQDGLLTTGCPVAKLMDNQLPGSRRRSNACRQCTSR